MADAGPCRFDVDNFPPQTRTTDMAKGNSQKKSHGSVLDFKAMLYGLYDRVVAREQSLCVGLHDEYEQK